MTAVYNNNDPLAPPSLTASLLSAAFSHSVSRSEELLSCAKTAVKVAKKQHEGLEAASPLDKNHVAWWNVNLSDLRLYDTQQHQHVYANNDMLEDGLALLRTMEAELKQLELLVRRRGHTNDPTEEISLSVKRLETDTRELGQLIRTLIPAHARGQQQRHWQILQQWFQSVTQAHGVRLKEILKVRGTVLTEQAQRRKMYAGNTNNNNSISKTRYDNPLFTIPTAPIVVPTSIAPTASASNGSSSNGHHHHGGGSVTTTGTQTSSAPASMTTTTTKTSPNGNHARPTTMGNGYYPYYNPSLTSPAGGVGYSGVGYGGSVSNAPLYDGSTRSGTGMRQRRTAAAASDDAQQQQKRQEQEQLLVQQQERQTQQRLQEAQHAERSLAELGTLFSKMTTLITQQSEVIDKVEDDVEAAQSDVYAGHQEITILYSIKKGNRALILKVFGLLIFFILFMRLYRN